MINASGKLVTPGLVDLHSHVYPYGSAIGIPADELVVNQCATTCVSAGDAGANNFAAFRRFIVGQTRTRLYAFVHIANIGLTPFPLPSSTISISRRWTPAPRRSVKTRILHSAPKYGCPRTSLPNTGPSRSSARSSRASSPGPPAKIMCHIGGVETGATDVANPRPAAAG